MQPWQVVEFEGVMYYAFLPARDMPKEGTQPREVVEKKQDSAKLKLEVLESMEVLEENEKEVFCAEKNEEEGTDADVGNEVFFVEEDVDDGAIIEALDEYYALKVKKKALPRQEEDTNLSGESDIFMCQECNVVFPVREMLARHMANEIHSIDQNESGLFKCKVCFKICYGLGSFKLHMALEHEGGEAVKPPSLPFVCTYCEYSSANKSTLQSHISRKHSKRKLPNNNNKPGTPSEFACDVCEFKCTNKRRLKEHLERKHVSEYKYECEYCGKKFKVKGDMRLHVRFKHKETPIVCEVCGKTCSNSNSLFVHQKWAHFKPKFQCPICKRRMVTQENLDQHILLQHERRETFVCEQCGKSFSENHRLKQHLMTHTGDRPYDCHICGKAFARRTAYRQHLLIHTGQRPYACDIPGCGKRFTQKPGLICHRKSHPGVHPPLPVVHIDHILSDFMRKE